MIRREVFLTAVLLGGRMLAAQATPPVILKVTENRPGTQITITGSGFGSVAPKVKLGSTPLTLNRFNGYTIVADLPDGVTPGAYLLAVENTSTHSTAVFSAAIGQTGPAGPIGPAGETGPKGAAGPAGSQGLTGAKGAAGATGPQGLTGTMGPIGPQGAKGDAGATGVAGPQGATGAAGAQGLTGATGSAGAKGDAGATGAAGPQGATGAMGPQGLAGATGPAGAIGNTGATGAAGPQGAMGAVGLAGPQGDAGLQGPTGPRGLAGLRGGTGATGAAGGQVWAGSMSLPADADGGVTWLGPASGANNALGATAGTTYTYLLQVPQSCTVSNFNVTATGVAASSGATVTLGYLESGDLFATSLSCVLPALTGAGEVSCSSTTALQLTQGERIVMVAVPAGQSGYDYMHIFSSFMCQ